MKLLIILSDDLFIRNYLETGALDGLAHHECHFAVAENCKKRDIVKGRPNFEGFIRRDQTAESLHFELFNILMWKHRGKSRTFYYRFSRAYKTYRKPTPRNFYRNAKGYLSSFKYRIWGSRLLSSWFVPRLELCISVNPDLESIVSRVKPDLLLFPSSAYDPIGNDVARLGKKLGIRTLFLIDNWDNLSSKSVFWALPDYLTVWGEQSRDHAVQIHGIPANRVRIIGTPRFQKYYEIESLKTASHFPFDYILFVGSALAFDELSALQILESEMESRPETYRGLKVVYRPHPWRAPRLCPDVFAEKDFKHVVLDPQVRDAYYNLDQAFQPGLDYYPTLLSRARMVVGPLTTMLIEALICGTQVLAIAYDDGLHYTSPHNALKYYRHFEGIEKIKGLHFTRTKAALTGDLSGLLTSSPGVSRPEILASLQYFIHNDGKPYAQRLKEIVEDVASL